MSTFGTAPSDAVHLQVGLLEHATTAAYFGQEDGTVKIRERVATRDDDMLVPADRQQAALKQVLDAVKRHRNDPFVVESNNRLKPVVEIDLDLCSLMPYRRTLAGLAQAGLEYNIPAFQEPLVQEKLQALLDDLKEQPGGQQLQGRSAVLPGYTAAAWNEWLRLPEVQEIMRKQPDLPWKADDKNKDTPTGQPGATVHSAFHRRFW